MKVRGKGQSPEQPMIGKARYYTNKAENKNTADRESTASTCTSAKGPGQDAGPPTRCAAALCDGHEHLAQDAGPPTRCAAALGDGHEHRAQDAGPPAFDAAELAKQEDLTSNFVNSLAVGHTVPSGIEGIGHGFDDDDVEKFGEAAHPEKLVFEGTTVPKGVGQDFCEDEQSIEKSRSQKSC